VLLSKIAVAIPFLVFCAAVHYGILLLGIYLGAGRLSGWGNFSDEFGNLLRVTLFWESATIMACGVAWMFSTFLRSSVICTGIAIAVLVAVGATVGVLADANRWTDSVACAVWCAVTLLIGITAFVGGSILYMRRVEP
jgi:hypothetical protein